MKIFPDSFECSSASQVDGLSCSMSKWKSVRPDDDNLKKLASAISDPQPTTPSPSGRHISWLTFVSFLWWTDQEPRPFEALIRITCPRFVAAE